MPTRRRSPPRASGAVTRPPCWSRPGSGRSCSTPPLRAPTSRAPRPWPSSRYSAGGGTVADEANAPPPNPGTAQAVAYNLLPTFGFSAAAQFPCLNDIYSRESGWRYNAENGESGAYGIPQALPGDKMASAGADWQTNVTTQIKWGLGYIKSRYGTPCGAWSFWQAHDFY